MRGESQLRAKHAFERSAGWRFGLVFGALLVFFAYVPDAFLLWSWHAEYWWVKLALAGVTILPLAILTGGIGGYLNWQLKLVVWALFALLAGWCATNIPFDGARLVLQNLDGNLRIAQYLPIPDTVGGSYGMLAILGAGAGLIVGGLHSILVNAAWERSTEDYRMTSVGWGLLFLCAPLAFALAFLYDGTAHLALRLPIERVQTIIVSGLNDPPKQDPNAMESHAALVYLTGQQWRARFSENYTIHLAAAESTQPGETYIDVSFDNGFNWRCRLSSSGEFAIRCIDLNTEYARYISEFVPRGSFRCADCEARVSQQAAEWRAANAHELSDSDRITVSHGAGSSIVVRVTPQGASGGPGRFECLISGANPVIMEQCRKR